MKAPNEQDQAQIQPAPAKGGVPMQSLPETNYRDFYLDIVKTLIGTFTGAGLAFLWNWCLQRGTRIRDELSAGRRALFMVRAQLDNFVNFRYAIRVAIDQTRRAIGDAPEWAFARPMAFDSTESNLFDFKSLAFLLSTPTGRAAFERLQFTERTYLDLVARFSDFNSSAQELQRTLAPLHREQANITWGAMEHHLGRELTARVRDHQRAVVLRFDRDEQRYRKAFELLNTVMTEMFGRKGTVSNLTIPEKFQEANLPPLPPALRTYVDSVPAET